MSEEKLDWVMGVGGMNVINCKGITSSQNDADRHWSPHVIIFKIYGQSFCRSVKLTAIFFIFVRKIISGIASLLNFLHTQLYSN